jgi:hypothetical protein
MLLGARLSPKFPEMAGNRLERNIFHKSFTLPLVPILHGPFLCQFLISFLLSMKFVTFFNAF